MIDLRWVRGLTAIIAIAAAMPFPARAESAARYPWRADAAAVATLAERISPPSGFARVPTVPGSFGEWLRGLPMRPPETPVHLHDGRLKANQLAHVAVVDIDTGRRDLQQCADAIMRLRAEYLLAAGRAREIGFNATDGKPQPFRGNPADYASFRRYLDRVFGYAGSYSLERELRPAPLAELRAGDVFIKGGFPGHAVLVVDMAAHAQTGEKRFLLLQSYMPAQDMHILANPGARDGTAWYALPGEGESLVTPEWTFPPRTLRRFKD